MARSWTKAQSAAIETKNKTLLVSAAAGSGKTSTLTERIIRSITDKDNPSDISKMLIVTFTRASAADLRAKILGAINEALSKDPTNKHLNSQLIKLGSAKICTIDSFYLDIIRENFATLGLSPSFRIADGAEIDMLSKSVMEDTVEHFYETDPEFPLFTECFSGVRNSDALTDVLLNLFSQTRSIPEGIEFLLKNAKRTEDEASLDFFATSYGKVIRSLAADAVSHYLNVLTSACEYFVCDEKMSKAYLTAFTYQRDFCASLLNAINDPQTGYKDAKALLETFAPPRIGNLKAEFATEDSEAYKEMRKDITAKLRELAKNSFSKEPEIISRAMRDTAKYTQKLYEVLTYFNEKLDEEKKLRGFLDFGDIRRYTMELLVKQDGSPTAIAKKYAEEFSDIYIDEYQDVDKVQDLIFSSIAKPDNRFMVGDIKQSIYSFRGAEPQVFADYRFKFPDIDDSNAQGSSAATIFMSENFRCDSTVIDFTNLVCSYIFSACADSIGYKESDDLRFSKNLPCEGYTPPLAQVAVISQSKNDDGEADFDEEESIDNIPDGKTDMKAVEAKFVASEINRLINEEKKADGTPIYPGDIAVLFRSRAMSPYLSEELSKHGILSSENDSDKYFENPDVLMMLCILNTVDNPMRDIFLTGTLRSPIFEFSMEDVIRIRKYCDRSYSLYDALCLYGEKESDKLSARCSEFISTLEEWRRMAASLPVDKFLRFLFDTEVFISSGLLLAPTENGGGNLLRLYEYARSFENGSFKGLYQFIEFINTLIEEGQKLESPPQGRSQNRVSLMTIHQSKGLEFPVCFVVGCASKFNMSDQKESLLFEYPLGVAMKIADTSGFARINTPMREAVLKSSKIKQTEEEMRVLYVALTRARERLYVTASTRRQKDAIISSAMTKAKFGSRHTLISCTSYLDWILTSLFSTAKKDCYSLNFIESDDIQSTHAKKSEPAKALPAPSEINQELFELLKQRFTFSYPHLELRKIPAKISVSKLSPDVLDDFDTASKLYELPATAAKATVPEFFITGGSKKASGADRGTATHQFLQFCDFRSAIKNGAKQEICRLVEKKFIPSEIAQLIYTEEIEKFLESELMDIILNAKQVIREQRFNILLPAKEFTRNQALAKELSNEHLAVQGIMDLIIIDKDGGVIIADYKTDRLSAKELENPNLAREKMNVLHSLQLSYYAKAAEMIFGCPCKKLCVYSTHAARLFDIDISPLTLPKSVDIL